MTEAVIDLESRSLLNLKKCGTSRYASDPSTEILCVGYAIDNDPVKLCIPGRDDKEFKYALKHIDAFVAHNAIFERTMWKHILGPKHGWPEPRLEQWIDTLALAYASALPGALDKVTAALNLKHQKDSVGSRIMLQVSKPRKARKSEDADAVHWYDDDERMQRLYAYCCSDVEAERELYHVLEPLSDKEVEVWRLDQVINDRGFCVDVKLAKAARTIAVTAFKELNKEMFELTDGQVSSINEVAKLKEWLLKQGVDAEDSLDKAAIGELLSRDLPAKARRAIELRQLGAQAATKKVDAFLDRANDDDRIRAGFQYHAAGTGRWAGRGAQIQNLKRTDENLDVVRAVEVIGSGDYARVAAEYKAPLATVGNIIRAMICAKPGHVLIGADFSGVEARACAWQADEYSKLDVFRAFDANKGPDPYIVAATKIFHKPADQIAKVERQVGKTAELAFGFAGGLGAWRKFDTSDKFTDAEVQVIKNAWRQAHPNIVQMWAGLYSAMETAIERRNEVEVEYDKIKFFCDDNFAWMTLPSGRRIAYPQATFGYVLKYGGMIAREEDVHKYSINEFVLNFDFEPQRVITWKDNSKGFANVKGWPGILTENAVSGIARDLLAEAMLRIDAAGIPIIATVHDEIICEVPGRGSDKVMEQFAALMVEVPKWAAGLPVVAKAWRDKRYIK